MREMPCGRVEDLGKATSEERLSRDEVAPAAETAAGAEADERSQLDEFVSEFK